jgi:hypothetical protein
VKHSAAGQDLLCLWQDAQNLGHESGGEWPLECAVQALQRLVAVRVVAWILGQELQHSTEPETTVQLTTSNDALLK